MRKPGVVPGFLVLAPLGDLLEAVSGYTCGAFATSCCGNRGYASRQRFLGIFMRLFLFPIIALAVTATGTVHAADLPLKAPPPPVYGWSGGYGGIAGGVGKGHSDQTD